MQSAFFASLPGSPGSIDRSRYDEKLFAKCSNSIWAPLLEKAFAKLMGCYEKMDSYINKKGYSAGAGWGFQRGSV